MRGKIIFSKVPDVLSHERKISHPPPDYTAMSSYFAALITEIGTLRNRNTFVRRAIT